ncbi:hypothetical protein [Demequina muriae]|uniref:Uncharacterized protein n=1 Tax=Demequina muriae TaxID=3051664 RepID=A0ABT8GL13_9MICO|nr:hypothetical protein [Demequina sp. EGI L300058]MDN4481621.1 hypothetical protein [Demequina sp. EGI L300058]
MATMSAPPAIMSEAADWRRVCTDATHWPTRGTPTKAAPTRLFDLPVPLDAAILEGEPIVADWATVSLRHLNGMGVRWHEHGAQTESEAVLDMFSRNVLYFRAEVRNAPIIASPLSVRLVDLTAAQDVPRCPPGPGASACRR